MWPIPQHIINLYGTCGLFQDALHVLDEMPHRDHFSWGSILIAYACLGATRQGKQVRARFVISPFCDNDFVKSSLVDTYAKCGLRDDAHAVFNAIKFKDLGSWNTMLSAYARSGRKNEALEMFERVPDRNLFFWTALISGFVQSSNGTDAFYLFIKIRRQGLI
ncbi:hypothetical protein Pint_26367 [Pistacia integerrima]|uniref:Uncharacterized protein n=1 Tax=Pistacia integerrima TaxID=434235 RepID=A0ACC0YHD7_9ROSI|nr:hypothetical protein Pint_26367 [Pistacia integerrima]